MAGVPAGGSGVPQQRQHLFGGLPGRILIGEFKHR
jgi:hypothetical protein